MHAWLCEETSGPAALRWVEQDLPALPPDAVRVRIHHAALNFPDLLIVQGKYQFKPALPFVPGSEFAGTVEAVGDAVRTLQPGQPVACFGGMGGFATAAQVPADRVVPLPPGFALDHGAAFLCTYGTSHHALCDRAALAPGETVLVLGAAGGVGSAAIQVAKAAGARVIAAATGAAKGAFCARLGADAVIDLAQEDLRERLKALTDGRGPDVVVDPVGGDLAEPAFRSIAWRGRYLVIGFAQGRIPALPLNLALLKGASLVGVFWGDFSRREPQRQAAAWAELAAWYAQGRVRPVIEHALPMQQLPLAFERMAQRQVLGKLVLSNPPTGG